MENDIVLAIKQLLSEQKNHEKFLDSTDVCQLLGISKSCLYKMNLKKAIPFFKPRNGKKVYYREEDVINHLTEIRISSQKDLDERAKNIINKNH